VASKRSNASRSSEDTWGAQIYDTLAEFDYGETGDFQYCSKRCPSLLAGRFSLDEQQCLKQDRDLFYDDLFELLDWRFNICATVTQVGLERTTSRRHGGLSYYSHKIMKKIVCEGDHEGRASWRAFTERILPPHSDDWKWLFFQNATQVQLHGGRNSIVLYQKMKLQFELHVSIEPAAASL